MKLKQGYVHMYVGNGKGKTSAASGLAIRARGAGLRVCFFQFLKGAKTVSSEIKILKKAGIKVVVFDQVHPIFGGRAKALKKAIRKDFKVVKDIIKRKRYDIVILDEILNAVSEHFLNANSLINIIKTKAGHTEIILTGRKAPKSILKYADYITFFKKMAHPYEKRITARKGIEY